MEQNEVSREQSIRARVTYSSPEETSNSDNNYSHFAGQHVLGDQNPGSECWISFDDEGNITGSHDLSGSSENDVDHSIVMDEIKRQYSKKFPDKKFEL